MTHPTIGNNLKEHRSRLGLTQAQLAERVGIARVSILAIEKGRYLPTIETALRISRALDLAVEELFWLKEEDK
jgi:putative transcriptional regulator